MKHCNLAWNKNFDVLQPGFSELQIPHCHYFLKKAVEYLSCQHQLSVPCVTSQLLRINSCKTKMKFEINHKVNAKCCSTKVSSSSPCRGLAASAHSSVGSECWGGAVGEGAENKKSSPPLPSPTKAFRSFEG